MSSLTSNSDYQAARRACLHDDADALAQALRAPSLRFMHERDLCDLCRKAIAAASVDCVRLLFSGRTRLLSHPRVMAIDTAFDMIPGEVSALQDGRPWDQRSMYPVLRLLLELGASASVGAYRDTPPLYMAVACGERYCSLLMDHGAVPKLAELRRCEEINRPEVLNLFLERHPPRLSYLRELLALATDDGRDRIAQILTSAIETRALKAALRPKPPASRPKNRL